MLIDLLKKKKNAILEKWLHLIIETYPTDTAVLLKRERDQFLNPVGYTFSREIEALFEGLLEGRGRSHFSASLNQMIKIRSVQDFSPSAAVGFIFLLKKVVKDVLEGCFQGKAVIDEWLAFQSKIDDLALLAFDIYMECREKISDIRVNEMRAQRDRAFELMSRSGFHRDEQ